MSGAAKLAVWHGQTDTHGFIIDVFEDQEQGLFIANITARTPVLMPALRAPGETPAMLNSEEPEKLWNEDLEMLKALTKARLTERYGRVRLFVERPA